MKTYLRHKSINIIDIKELVVLEYLDFEGKYKDYVEKHDFWEICFVEQGEIGLMLEGENFTLKTNDMFFIPPDYKHYYTSAIGNKSKAFVICFECSYSGLKFLGGNGFKLNEDEQQCMKNIICESENTFCVNENDVMELIPEPCLGGQQAIIIQLEYLLIKLLRKISSKKNSEIVFLKNDDFYREITGIIIQYLKENVSNKLYLNDICNRVNYSRAFVCKIFKEETGLSIFAYFNRLKMKTAQNMLEETELPISDIAWKLGFSDSKYFTDMFKKHVGNTPTKYRKSKSKRM